MITILGIDPGDKGALAWLNHTNETIQVIDMPNDETLSAAISVNQHSTKFAVLEDVHSMPYQSATSTFKFGRHKGYLEGVLAALKIPVYKIDPAMWKAELQLSRNKNESIALAKKLYPAISHLLTLRKHDGRAEAMLLAHFGQRFL